MLSKSISSKRDSRSFMLVFPPSTTRRECPFSVCFPLSLEGLAPDRGTPDHLFWGESRFALPSSQSLFFPSSTLAHVGATYGIRLGLDDPRKSGFLKSASLHSRVPRNLLFHFREGSGLSYGDCALSSTQNDLSTLMSSPYARLFRRFPRSNSDYSRLTEMLKSTSGRTSLPLVSFPPLFWSSPTILLLSSPSS